MRKKLMIVSDAPSSSTGFGRITRELCQRIYADLSDEFELATFGTAGNVSSRFPWRQYVVTNIQNFTLPELPRVWDDFAGKEGGIVFFLFNPSWLWWVADPTKLGACTLKDFLLSKPFETWLYAPIDAEGPYGKLPIGIAEILAKFDRTLYYTKWAADLAFKTDEKAYGDHLPHGTDTSIFFPRDKQQARDTFIERVTDWPHQPLVNKTKMIAIVGTNTPRKDFPFGLEVCAELVRRGINIGIWLHCDRFKGHWDILGMIDHFGLKGRVIPTNKFMSDEDMAWAYSACDVLLGIARGGGWELPHLEAMACGVPCVHCDYAGGAEPLPERYKIKPRGLFYDDIYLNQRPVMWVSDWADKVEELMGEKASLPPEFDWNNCWPKWKEWLMRGLV